MYNMFILYFKSLRFFRQPDMVEISDISPKLLIKSQNRNIFTNFSIICKIVEEMCNYRSVAARKLILTVKSKF